MLQLIEASLRLLQVLMLPVMAFWVIAGIVVIERNRRQVAVDREKLEAVRKLAAGAAKNDLQGLLDRRGAIDVWAIKDENKTSTMSHWIDVAHNISVASNEPPEAGALTDGIWSYERERFYWFRFYSRYAILCGLLFTSIGLCTTLADIRPALEATGLTETEWLKQVKGAMAQALTGMSTAFYSSLLGIMITGVLQLWYLARFAHVHNEYVLALDKFVQGSLIPIFSVQVEKDRNSVIFKAMTEAGAWFKQSFDQMTKVAEQLGVVQADARKTVEEVGALKDSLVASTEAVSTNLKTFAEDVKVIHQMTENLHAYAKQVDTTMKKGLGTLHETQQELIDSTKRSTVELSTVVGALNEAKDAVAATNQNTQEAAAQLKEQAHSMRQAAATLASQQDGLASLNATHRKLEAEWKGLHDALVFNEGSIKAEIDARRNALESLIEELAKQSKDQSVEPIRLIHDQYLKYITQLTDKRFADTHASQVSFNETMTRNWGQLMKALGAVEPSRP